MIEDPVAYLGLTPATTSVFDGRKVTIDLIAEDVRKRVRELRRRHLELIDAPVDVNKFVQSRNVMALSVEYGSPADFIENVVRSNAAASFETLFGHMIQSVAEIIARRSPFFNVMTSPIPGADFLVFSKLTDRHYLVFMKSGPHWGNSSSWPAICTHLKAANKNYHRNNPAKKDTLYSLVAHAYGPVGVSINQHADYYRFGDRCWSYCCGSCVCGR